MKKYKFLVPLFLLVIFIASFYSLYNAKIDTLNQYNTYVNAAREYRKQGIEVDAFSNYLSAIEMSPSPELYLEVGEYYCELNQTKKAINWGETFLEAYPKVASPYEFLIDLYMKTKDYVACFDLADVLKKRELTSLKIEENLKEIEYEFYFNGEYDDVLLFSNSRCPVLIGDKWGYASANGGLSVGARFLKVGAFSNNLAPVVDIKGDAYFIDSQGNKKYVVLGVENVVELGPMSEGVYALYDGNSWSFYNQNHIQIFGGYHAVSSISNGVVAVEHNGVWSLVNMQGTDLTGKTYDGVAMDENSIMFRNNRIFVCNGAQYDMIDVTGAICSKQKYEDVRIFNDSTYAAVKIDGKWGFIDALGDIKIEAKYEDARSFSYGFAAVKTDGVWGFIDMNGNFVIEPQFVDAKDFNVNGSVFVNRGRCWELLKLYKYNH